MAAEARPHQKLLRASGERGCSLGTSSQRPSSPSRSAGFSSAAVRTVSTHWMRVMLRAPPGTRTHRQAGFVSLPDRAPAWRGGVQAGELAPSTWAGRGFFRSNAEHAEHAEVFGSKLECSQASIAVVEKSSTDELIERLVQPVEPGSSGLNDPAPGELGDASMGLGRSPHERST